MPRIPYVEKEAATGEVKELYDMLEKQFGGRGIPNMVKAFANSPGLVTKIFSLGNYFMTESSLKPRLRELAAYIVFKWLNCEHGFGRHIEIAERVGLTREQIDNIGSYPTSPLFSDEDKLILRYAEEMTLKGQVDDQLFRQVQNLIGQKDILELTATTAFFNMMARNVNVLQIELEQWKFYED